MKLKLAVIGKDVSKSVSPQIHEFIAKKSGNEVQYDRVSIAEERFEREIEGLFEAYDGFNVTIPYKLSIIPHLKSMTADAKKFGAVNTVKCFDRSGDNTDGLGFSLSIKNEGLDVSGKKVLLLGAGGAGRSVSAQLKEGGAEVYVYDLNYGNVLSLSREFGVIPVDKLSEEDYYMIVNATGVGMHKSEGKSPAGEGLLSRCKAAFDLIYVPRESEFLRLAKGLGKKTVNGLGMLFYQAYYSECFYFGLRPSAEEAKILFEEFKKEIKL